MKIKGFGRNYFSLMAIQATVSTVKLIALFSSIRTCDERPLTLKINSPPTPYITTI